MSEAEARAWIGEMLAVIRKGCTLSDTQIDEKIVDMVQRAIDSDVLWVWVWRVISKLIIDEDGPILVETEAAMNACEVEAINPILVLAVIRALVELWRSFKDE